MSYLMIPIRMDGLRVCGHAQPAVQQIANFSRLPFVGSRGDINSNTYNLSEAILSPAFQDKNMQLKPGIHLHWSMPNALTKGEDHVEEGLIFPALPNRWLVSRRIGKRGTDAFPLLNKQWIIESDYLAPEGVDKTGSSVSILLSPKKEQKELQQPYRYLGRKMPLQAWMNKDDQAEYLEKLTVVGYGETTFSAFYPNCYSVFGFYDPDYTDEKEYSYDLMGWYSDLEKDPIQQFLLQNKKATYQDIYEHFNWKTNLHSAPNPSTQVLAYSSIIPTTKEEKNAPENKVKITVANTETEALSAYLASELAKGKYSNRKLVEDRIEAIQQQFNLEQNEIDLLSKFNRRKHENSFMPVNGGSIWEIKSHPQKEKEKETKSKEKNQNQEIERFMQETHKNLMEINALQKQYNTAQSHIESLRTQLFSDWYKYMVSCYTGKENNESYPDIDRIKFFIEQQSQKVLEQTIQDTGELVSVYNKFSDKLKNEDSLATQLAKKLNSLHQKTRLFNQTNKKKHPFYLTAAPDERYWQPANPVILIDGEITQPTNPQEKDGILNCHLLPNKQKEITADFQAILLEIDSLYRKDSEGFAFNHLRKPTWNPFILDWQIEFLPSATTKNKHLVTGNYSSKFITENYELPIDNTDLRLKEGKGKITPGNTYTGRCILVNKGKNILAQALQDRLQKTILPAYNLDHTTDEMTKINTEQDCQNLMEWHKKKYPQRKEFEDPTFTLLLAYKKLIPLKNLAQAVNGFNQALLMQKQTLELRMEDPLGFTSYKKTSEALSQLMGQQLGSSAVPSSFFHPIRAGCFKIKRLRLVDTFGQSKELEWEAVATTYQLAVEGNSQLISLPPRIIQPCKLSFKWLPAEARTNTPSFDQNPICGWVMANPMEERIAFYSTEGKELGSFVSGKWRQGNSINGLDSVADISNSHLRTVAQYIDTQNSRNSEFIQQFISTLEKAVENTELHTAALHSTALYGKPLAIVRAKISLELNGLPAINHSWNNLIKDMGRTSRSTDRFTHVKFPVRLGDEKQYKDGMIGFWREEKNKWNQPEALEPFFFSPQSTEIEYDWIKSNASIPLEKGHFDLSIASKPETTLLLMDVRSTIHIHCGILPGKRVSIPLDYYSSALQNIEISFLVAPILSDKYKIEIPLPQLNEQQWSFVEAERVNWIQDRDQEWHMHIAKWKETGVSKKIKKDLFISEWNKIGQNPENGGVFLWNYLLHLKWIKNWAIEENYAIWNEAKQMEEKDTQNLPPFEKPFQGQETFVKLFLNDLSEHLKPISQPTTFQNQLMIKEGWLKITNNPKTNSEI
jgi:hypothetical protein